MIKASPFTILVVILAVSNAASAQQCTKQSPTHAVALLELYTSEGCSSCPPADKWFSELANKGIDAENVVPLAFHVDYWDKLGWKDPFASSKFSERQYNLASVNGTRVVYTPGVFLNLREFRDWRSASRLVPELKSINKKPADADIRIQVDGTVTSELRVKTQFRVHPGSMTRTTRGYVALFENGLQSDVNAGENSGATLRHDYVVREWVGPIDIDKGGGEVRKNISIQRNWNAKNLGVAAFIQDANNGTILQALSMRTCGDGSHS